MTARDEHREQPAIFTTVKKQERENFYEDATGTPEPAEIVVEPEEEEQEEDHVQFNDKGGNEADSDDEGMISDYDSEPEMSEDDVLKYIANEL